MQSPVSGTVNGYVNQRGAVFGQLVAGQREIPRPDKAHVVQVGERPAHEHDLYGIQSEPRDGERNVKRTLAERQRLVRRLRYRYRIRADGIRQQGEKLVGQVAVGVQFLEIPLFAGDITHFLEVGAAAHVQA